MKKLPLNLFPFLLILIVILGCRPAQNEAPVSYRTPEPLPVYKEPTIGMDTSNFRALCQSTKERTEEDHVETYKDSRGSVVMQVLGYSENRAKNDCWGTFYFVNYKLESIHRH